MVQQSLQVSLLCVKLLNDHEMPISNTQKELLYANFKEIGPWAQLIGEPLTRPLLN